jgi:hypothetical protein
VQDDFRHALPICPFRVSVEQAQIGDETLLVVARQIPVSGRNIRILHTGRGAGLSLKTDAIEL